MSCVCVYIYIRLSMPYIITTLWAEFYRVSLPAIHMGFKDKPVPMAIGN